MTKGLKQSVCDQSFYNGPVSKFWAYAFVLSKAPELGEWLFLKKYKNKNFMGHNERKKSKAAKEFTLAF